jgi:hypothetical protein
MLQLFLDGGVPMLFVLVLGLAALIAAARFMRAPDARRSGTVSALTLAAAAAAVTGLATDLAVVGHHVAQSDQFTEPLMLARVCLQGLSESLSPIILGATLLCVTWLVMAVGYRRLASRLPV